MWEVLKDILTLEAIVIDAGVVIYLLFWLVVFLVSPS